MIAAAVLLAIALAATNFLRAPERVASPVPQLAIALTPTPIAPTLAVAAPKPRRIPTLTPTPAPIVVEIHDFYYKPNNVSIRVGETILWRNRGGVLHTVTSEDRTLNSRNLGTNMEYEYTFTQAGVFKYYDSLHAGPTGWVYVSE